MSFCAVSYAGFGNAIVKVYEAGEEISLNNIEVIVGSELEFVVCVDANDYWSGGLFIDGDDRELGYLAGRDPDPNTRDCEDSHLQAAGELAEVTPWEDSYIQGFDLCGSLLDTAAGDWFVIDYYPEKAGVCNIAFYNYGASWNDPNTQIIITQIFPGDCTGDNKVDMEDLAVLASYWNMTDCNDPNVCGQADLDSDGDVNINDMTIMANYWLLGANFDPNSGISDPIDPNNPADPNDPSDSNDDPNNIEDPAYVYPEDPNVIYSIVDSNGLSEITIDVNDTITLYVNKSSVDPNVFQVQVFFVEVFPTDPNQGYIDNTSYDRNNPPGPGTARILFEPRWSFFDGWGPGIYFTYGIEFFGVNFDPIADGSLSSFEYTATKEGDAVLELYTDTDPYPRLESILIHQVDPNSP
jgi:hypothetical protein